MKPSRRFLSTLFSLLVLISPSSIFAETNSLITLNCTQASPHCGNTPTPTFDANGTLWLTYEHNGNIYVSTSSDHAKTFSAPVKVNSIAEKIYTNGENRPKIALDNKDNIFISWTQKTPGRFSGDIRFSRSTDNGKNFQNVQTINSNRNLIGHRFDSLNVNSRGDIIIAWLDKRDKLKAKENNQAYTGTAIYYSTSNDHGKTFSENIRIADHTCECCRIASSLNKEDNLTFLWRHIFGKNTRDHALVTLNPDNTISKVIRATKDDWNIDSCPHHGPDITYGNDNNLYYTWFTQGANHKGILFGKFDTQNNKIASHQIVDDAPSAAHPQILNLNGKLINAWKQYNGEETEILARYSSDNGNTWSNIEILNSTKDTSDHPLLISYNNIAYLSWHSKLEGYTLTPIELQ